MTNHCPGIAPLPNAELFRVQARSATGLTWLVVADQMKIGWESSEERVYLFTNFVVDIRLIQHKVLCHLLGRPRFDF